MVWFFCYAALCVLMMRYIQNTRSRQKRERRGARITEPLLVNYWYKYHTWYTYVVCHMIIWYTCHLSQNIRTWVYHTHRWIDGTRYGGGVIHVDNTTHDTICRMSNCFFLAPHGTSSTKIEADVRARSSIPVGIVVLHWHWYECLKLWQIPVPWY